MRAPILLLALAAVAGADELARPRHNSAYVRDDVAAVSSLVAEARKAAEAGDALAAADRLQALVLTDERGLLDDPSDVTTLIGRLTADEAAAMLGSGKLQGGIVPKLEGCLTATRGGVPRVHIIDGRIPHALLMEIFTDRGIGTLIARDAAAMPE